MRPVKIVIVGAGSASFGLNALATLLREADLRGSTLGLVDHNAEGLRLVHRLADRMNQEWQAGLTIESATDFGPIDQSYQRPKASTQGAMLDGADFVVCAIEVGPREKLWQLDWEITQRHGVRQPYAENGGLGGFAHAARNIPPILAIARAMEQHCPQAPLILLSNPLPRLCRAVAKYTTITPIGLCHQVLHGYRLAGMALAERLALEVPEGMAHPISMHDPAFRRRADVVRFNRQVYERLAIMAAGLNHFTWMLDVRDRRTGEDLYPELKERLLSGPAVHEPLTCDMLRLTGYVPVSGDTHMSEYLPYLHNPVTKPWERYGLYLYPWDQGERNRTAMWERIERLAGEGGPDLEELRQAVSEGVFEVVQGMTENTHSYHDALNVPNQGAIANLPSSTIIEAPALVSGMGALPLRIGPLPPMIAELCRREAELVEVVVDASVHGSRAMALQALALDPVIDDLAIARAVLDDMLETHSEHLPQFHRR